MQTKSDRNGPNDVGLHRGRNSAPRSLTKLVTLGFEENVGRADRVFRLVSGASLVAAGWHLDVPTWARVVLFLLGVMWTATGVLSKCSIYYALGYSSCPARQVPPPG